MLRLLLCWFWGASALLAQPSSVDYLVTNQGDTIRGAIQFNYLALNAQAQPILPQQIHAKQAGTYRSTQLRSFRYRHRDNLTQGAQVSEFHAHPRFLDQQFFYEIAWQSDTAQLVRTYELGYPKPTRTQYAFMHRYFWWNPQTETILVEVTKENAKQLCAQYMRNETAFLTELNKKKKLAVFPAPTGLSKLLRKHFGK